MEVVAALERSQAEVKAGRRLISAHRDEIKSLKGRVEKLTELDEGNAQLRARLDAKAKSLELAIVDLQSAVATKTEQAERLKKEKAELNRKLKNSHTREKIFAGIAAVLAGVLILK